jgi:hypothetical protein
MQQQADAPGQLGDGMTDPAPPFGCLPHHLPDRVPPLELLPHCVVCAVREEEARAERGEQEQVEQIGGKGRLGGGPREEWPETPGRRPTGERLWGCDHLLLEVSRMCSGGAPAAVHLDDNFLEGVIRLKRIYNF